MISSIVFLQDEDASNYSRFIDIVALRVTFNAYHRFQSGFDKWSSRTNDSLSKMFYLLSSQQFCSTMKSPVAIAVNLIRNENLPNYFRVNSMMMNSANFTNAFECHSEP